MGFGRHRVDRRTTRRPGHLPLLPFPPLVLLPASTPCVNSGRADRSAATCSTAVPRWSARPTRGACCSCSGRGWASVTRSSPCRRVIRPPWRCSSTVTLGGCRWAETRLRTLGHRAPPFSAHTRRRAERQPAQPAFSRSLRRCLRTNRAPRSGRRGRDHRRSGPREFCGSCQRFPGPRRR